MHIEMKYRNTLAAFLMAIAMLAGSCNKDEAIQYFVEAPLQPYFDRFAAEAALRNVVIDFETLKISGTLGLIVIPQVVGQCVHNDKEPDKVIIDKNYWDGSDDLKREFLVFHELGHCALNRPHLDDADSHGNCKSIMTSGTGLCQINYTADTREALLDELFKP
jgi:hypothetical protein